MCCTLIYSHRQPEFSTKAGLKDEETEGQYETTTESIKAVNDKINDYEIKINLQSAAPGGKKGKKAKKTFADIDW